MRPPSREISIALISGPVEKTPKGVTYPFVFDEACRLAASGIAVHVLRAKTEEASFSRGVHFYGFERRIDINAIWLALRNLPIYPLISLLRNPVAIYWENLYTRNVSRVIEEDRIDLIHAHFAFPEGLVGLLAKRRTGKPLVVTVHGYDILMERSVGYGVRLSRKIDPIVRRVLNESDAVMAASTATFDETRRIVSDPQKIHLIPNGVDTQRFNQNIDASSLRNRLGIQGCTVVFALRAHEPKYGLEYLIKAARMVAGKKEKTLFVIGGDGSLRRYHERLADMLQIRDRVVFTGWIPQKEVPCYYAMSDIVVVPSLQEAFGLTVSEAMACGKPVIGTRVGGIPDQIVDGYNGFLVNPGTPEEIARKISWCARNPEEARSMGARGRRTVEEKFNISRRIDRIVSLYESILRN